MSTIKEIKDALLKETEWQSWMSELETDTRQGVIKALEQWHRHKEKYDYLLSEHKKNLNLTNHLGLFRMHL